ncbi:MAG: hypothetical protein Q9M91_00750 [Candidatus Dojkabacteria bacterium]|nr:hypothetical protein [Candidatus Dojkabacteria bacterium]MDQ7020357.1 hypothetical protein [Candidatus Dojkabacteria bacterium]
MTDKAFAEIIFDKTTELEIENAVSNLITEDDLYYSDQVEHIRGLMTKTLHLTLFLGLPVWFINDKKLLKLLKSVEISELKPEKLNFFVGYMGLYKVLYLEVKDKEMKDYFQLLKR